MFRITESFSNTLRLSGELTAAWLAELERSCVAVLDAGGGLTLDFANVSFIDRAALELLVSLHRRGVVFANCSPFQREQIRQATGDTTPCP
jgi:ABC-type transporter Mla MlaB component